MDMRVLCGFLVLVFCASHWSCNVDGPSPVVELDTVVFVPSFKYGISTDTFEVEHTTVKRDQNLSLILQQYGVGQQLAHDISILTKDVFDVRKISVGKPLTAFMTKDSTKALKCLVYEASVSSYLVFDLRDSLQVYLKQKPIVKRLRLIEGEITSSLYAELDKLGHSPALAVELASIFAWTVDFYRIQKHDRFTALYEEDVVEEQTVGISRILAATFESGGKKLDGYRYEKNGEVTYYDGKGQSLKKAFLQAPLKFSRISSSYSKARLHPVLRTLRPHLGTDYAAPHGTPIMAVGDGTVSEARHTSGNGNYVKIRHNKTYETQYLHMSKFHAGIKPGARVRQGDIIGYVGSTGLATGPHVCFRFWKNGKQIDHRKEIPPRSEPIAANELGEFNKVVYWADAKMDSIRRVQ